MSPAKLQSLLQTALTHHRAGRLAEADGLYAQARAAAPKHFDVLHLSGLVAFQRGRIPEAIDLLGRAYAANRKNAVCEMRLGLALLSASRLTEAEQHLRHAVEVQSDLAEGWDNLAYCLKLQDRFSDAVPCHQKTVTLAPGYAAGWCNYGLTLNVLGQPRAALQCHERALSLDPKFTAARYARAQALQQLHRTKEAIADYDAVLAAEPRHHAARSNRLFALHNLDDISRDQLFAEHVAYGRAVEVDGAKPAAFEVGTAARDLAPDRRLRLAVLSPDLRQHSCAYFIEPLLRHLDPAAFELYLYHDHFREDAVSARLRSLAAVWRNFRGQPDAAVAALIRADAPDIVIDLAGHTGLSNRLLLFARRLAPVQITYLGYPNTTGVTAMDYRFTDAVADPIGDADEFATEKLVRFAPTAWCYAPPPDAPEPAPAPCLKNGYVTFGSFNDLAKLSTSTLALWMELLAAVPTSRLRLKGRGLAEAADRADWAERLGRAGIPVDRVIFSDRTPETREHLSQYADVDIALDPFPYHGTTTTCEALWMGVPVISRVGDRHVSRVGASLLTAVGHPEWIAHDEREYVVRAVTLAADVVELSRQRQLLRENMRRSPLLDSAAQSAQFAAALRECWQAVSSR